MSGVSSSSLFSSLITSCLCTVRVFDHAMCQWLLEGGSCNKHVHYTSLKLWRSSVVHVPYVNMCGQEWIDNYFVLSMLLSDSRSLPFDLTTSVSLLTLIHLPLHDLIATCMTMSRIICTDNESDYSACVCMWGRKWNLWIPLQRRALLITGFRRFTTRLAFDARISLRLSLDRQLDVSFLSSPFPESIKQRSRFEVH